MTDMEYIKVTDIKNVLIDTRTLVLRHDPLNKVEDAFLDLVQAKMSYAIGMIDVMTKLHFVDQAQKELMDALEAQNEATND